MNVLRQSVVLVAALVGLAACGTYTNLLDGNNYRALLGWPLLCHPDGSLVLAQAENSTGGFTDPTETAEPCAPIKLQAERKQFTPDRSQGVDAPAAEAPDGFFGGDGDMGLGGNFF